MTKKVSIILPVYNVEKYLRECLESLVNQTLDEIQIVAVNDGSTDGSLAVLEEYHANYPDILEVFTTVNKGVSHARNYGLDKAAGEFIMFVDSDDYLEPDTCEKMYHKAVTDHNDLVLCGRYNVYEVKEQEERKKTPAGTNMMSQNFALRDYKFELAHISPFPWDKMFHHKLIQKFRFPENIRFEDLVLVYQSVCQAECIGVVEEALYHYRRTTKGGFLNTFSIGTLDIVKAMTLFVDYMEEMKLLEYYKDEVVYICARHFMFRYPALFEKKSKGKLDLKMKMIQQTQEFLDQRFPDWRDNHYLKYTAASDIKNHFKLYSSRELLTEAAQAFGTLSFEEWEKKYMPAPAEPKKKKSRKKKSILYKLVHLPVRYRYTKYYVHLPVKENVILLESKHGEDLAGNIFSILQELSTEKYNNFKCYLVTNGDNQNKFASLLSRYGILNVNYVEVKTEFYLKLLASAKYLVTDTSFPPYYIKKKEQVYLNTWHGTPLKTMGRIVPEREYALGNIQRNFLIADYLLYQNEFSKNAFLTDYMIDSIYRGSILLSGYPRNTAFFKTDRYENIRNELGIAQKQVIVYMPTWRGLMHKMENKRQLGQLYDYFVQIDYSLEGNQIFYVRLHPFVKQAIDFKDFRHIQPFPEEYETYDFLNASDVLVTDYSSIMFDYAVSQKKIILFAYDKEEYLKGRGMYLNIDELELPVVKNVDELMKELRQKNQGYPRFFEKFCSIDNADCTRKVCDKVFLGKDSEGLTVINPSKETKENILVHMNQIPDEEVFEKFINRVNTMDHPSCQYFLSFGVNEVRKKSSVLSMLKREVGYFPLQPGHDITLGEKIAAILNYRFSIKLKLFQKKCSELAKREQQKNYGKTEFTTVLTTQSWDEWMRGRFK